ncbi:RrF2 family transcriptional regulator [Parafannyhessea umbonata]|uniref:RrF2 family transcriptional regulator n=1 Tax=Parafannyhessea umbonata TaxID=604330 RepID=UPI0026E96765|nr:Rrf2 family transcriptional regulator [Parafannyhessea umbonata]MCI6682108.1 Rrf2 family transcriptional regulator [Parafannyhessea umbonata]MCI7219893.1 Rrf2 family transcriptional regulator [Parafannyhessea umbonata]
MDTKFSTAIHLLILVSEAEQPMSSEQIATSVGTNPSYVRKVAARLSHAGIIEGRRGRSGFTLLKAPEDVSMLEVYRAVEQTDSVHVFDIHQNPSDECIVGRNIRPVLGGMFRHTEQVVEDELAGATLADCMARMRERIDKDEKDPHQPDNRQQEGNRK